MAYVILSLLGLIAVLCVRLVWRPNTQIIFILTVITIGFAFYLFIDTFFFRDIDTIHKGFNLKALPWFEVILYFVMLLGMAAKYFYDAIGEGSTLNFQKWQLIKPMLVSPIVFAAIYGMFAEESSRVLLLTFSFQNGFFWKTVLDQKQI